MNVAGLGAKFTDLIRQVMGQQPPQPCRLLVLVPIRDAMPRSRFQQRLLHDARKVDLALQPRVDLAHDSRVRYARNRSRSGSAIAALLNEA